MMGKAEKAEKARDEAKADLEKMRSEQDKQKDIFNVEWNDVIDKSIKEQHETSITPAQDILKLARTQTTSAEKKVRDNTAATDGDSQSFAQKLRSNVARAAWGIARDTGSIHVSMQMV